MSFSVCDVGPSMHRTQGRTLLSRPKDSWWQRKHEKHCCLRSGATVRSPDCPCLKPMWELEMTWVAAGPSWASVIHKNRKGRWEEVAQGTSQTIQDIFARTERGTSLCLCHQPAWDAAWSLSSYGNLTESIQWFSKGAITASIQRCCKKEQCTFIKLRLGHLSHTHTHTISWSRWKVWTQSNYLQGKRANQKWNNLEKKWGKKEMKHMLAESRKEVKGKN